MDGHVYLKHPLPGNYCITAIEQRIPQLISLAPSPTGCCFKVVVKIFMYTNG